MQIPLLRSNFSLSVITRYTGLDFGTTYGTIANEASFFRFMEDNGPASDGGKRNYLSWLRYVSELYDIDFVNLTEYDVNEIFQALRMSQNTG